MGEFIGRILNLAIYFVMTLYIMDFLAYIFGHKSRYYKSWLGDDEDSRDTDKLHGEDWDSMGGFTKIVFGILYLVGLCFHCYLIYNMREFFTAPDPL